MGNFLKNSNRKVTLASPSFSGGGAERVMVTLANHFSECGYSVDFLVLTDRGPYQSLLSTQVRKIDLTKGAVSKPVRALALLAKLFFYFRSHKNTPVLSTNRELNLLFLAIHFFSRAKTPLYIREAATLDRFLSKPALKDRLLFRLMKCSYPRAKTVIANSEVTKTDLLDHLGLSAEKVKVIYNPLDLNTIRNAVRNTQKSTTPTLVACGRLVSMKNFEHAIFTLESLRKKYPGIILRIIGEGPHRQSLEKLVEELGLSKHVEFTGFLDDPYSAFAAAHVFVQTSRWEGFGYVLAEAMACGTPVVCYDSRGAMREILADGRYGSLVPNEDVAALAQALKQQLISPTPASLLNEAAKRFDVERIAKQYLDALNA